MVQFFKGIFLFSRMNFEDYFRKFKFLSFYGIMGKNYILKYQDAILMTFSSVFITSDYVITI